jgi:hypothetical protein
MNKHITLTLTIGKRPDLLAQTLDSLLSKISFENIVAINDFGDEETNRVFTRLCPNGNLINIGSSSGHHTAIDWLLKNVRTPYVFHCEDDWLFETTPDLESALNLLSLDSTISSVCFRKVEDFGLEPAELDSAPTIQLGSIEYRRLDGLHDQWHGYTFNPHLIGSHTLKSIGHFSNFRKERHISRSLREQGQHVAYLNPGSCKHIGADCSVSVRPSAGQRLLQQIKKWTNRG